MILETLPMLGALTVDQQLRLVSELWQDVSSDPTITSETAALLDQRLEQYAAAPDAVRTTDEVAARIMELKKRALARK